MELALRVLGLMCDGQNRTLQVNCKKKLSTIFTIVTKKVEISELILAYYQFHSCTSNWYTITLNLLLLFLLLLLIYI